MVISTHPPPPTTEPSTEGIRPPSHPPPQDPPDLSVRLRLYDEQNVPRIFTGDDTECTICTMGYDRGQHVVRLRCGHTFHKECWGNFQMSRVHDQEERRRQREEQARAGTSIESINEHLPHVVLSCPNCRGIPHTTAEWYWIGQDVTVEGSDFIPAQPVATDSHTTVSNLLEVNSEHYTVGSTAGSPRNQQASSSSQTQTLLADAMPTGRHFHVHTRLPDGRPCLLIDPGSVGNLCGDKWAKSVAQAAARNGHKPTYERRSKPLRVSGVGEGSQSCQYDCKLPIALRQCSDNPTAQISVGHITTPTVPNSELPGLLGLQALRTNRAILDMNTLKMYFLGPGDYDLARGLPPGTDCFQCELAPSGHLVIPCCEFSGPTQAAESTLTLITRHHQIAMVPPPPAEAPRLGTAGRAHSAPPPVPAHTHA